MLSTERDFDRESRRSDSLSPWAVHQSPKPWSDSHLAPPMRRALERIIQQGKGGLVVLGSSDAVSAASSGGFKLNGATFSPARLAELSKMDGGVILDDTWGMILEANVHFVPDGSIHTEETGARHRTAERLAVETGKPVVAVSEGRKVATLFYQDDKIELAQPAEGRRPCQPRVAEPRSAPGAT